MMRRVQHTNISAEELDRRFDAGEDVTAHLDLGRARRPDREQRPPEPQDPARRDDNDPQS